MNGYKAIDNIGCSAFADKGVVVTNFSSPSITSQPSNTSACTGEKASFSIIAFGDGINNNTFSYQWQEYNSSWSNLNDGGIYSGTQTPILSISNISVPNNLNNYQYRCIISSSDCSANNLTSNSATLSVNTNIGLTSFNTSDPKSWTKELGESVTFYVYPSYSAVSYQWQYSSGFNKVNIQGATNSSYTISSINYSNEGDYTCIISKPGSGYCNVTSNTATLTIKEHTISGRIIDLNNNPLRGIEIDYDNNGTNKTFSGSDGKYNFKIKSGWYGTITAGGITNAGLKVHTIHNIMPRGKINITKTSYIASNINSDENGLDFQSENMFLQADFTVNNNPENETQITVAEGDLVQFQDLSRGLINTGSKNSTWSWDFGDNSQITMENQKQNPLHSYSKTNEPFTVTLTVTDKISGKTNKFVRNAYIHVVDGIEIEVGALTPISEKNVTFHFVAYPFI